MGTDDGSHQTERVARNQEVVEMENKTEVVELIAAATKVPEEKREFLLGYMQCMVDMDERGKESN